MHYNFTKMHGLGNDFVVIDAINQTFSPGTAILRQIADRRTGIGCDQILLVESARSSQVDFRYRIFNADGAEVEQCGNGARCFARFVHDKGLTDKTVIAVETSSGPLELTLQDDGNVRVNMGIPELLPKLIPFEADAQAIEYDLESADQNIKIGAVSMGNPHAVIVVADADSAPVGQLGPAIESHPRFPNRVNVGFVEIVDRARIRVRVFERGVGETRACGSGACAAVVHGHRLGLIENEVGVDLAGGRLVISWKGEGEPVWMTGPATTVYEGQMDI